MSDVGDKALLAQDAVTLVYTGDGPIPPALLSALEKFQGLTIVDAKDNPEMVVVSNGFIGVGKRLLDGLKAMEIADGLPDLALDVEPVYRKFAHKGRGRWPRS